MIEALQDERVKVRLTVDIPRFGERLKEIRLAKNLSPAQVAVSSEMSVANLYRIESESIKEMPVETLQRLGDALGEDFSLEIWEALQKRYAPPKTRVGPPTAESMVLTALMGGPTTRENLLEYPHVTPETITQLEQAGKIRKVGNRYELGGE